MGSQGSERAIQAVTSKHKADGSVKGKHIITIGDKDKLKDVLCDGDFKDLPVLVFSVAGRTRGGKSFLINMMIKYLECKDQEDWKNGRMKSIFEWKSGEESVTRGLWISPKIYLCENNKKEKIGIIFLDNQGLFDGEQTSGECIAMSGISTAISYWQMFNIKEKIITQDLESIYKHLNHPQIKKLNSSHDEDSVSCHLMFIVRDFMGKHFGIKNGKEHIDKEQLRGTEEHKTMWKELHGRFQNGIQCLTLPHPGSAVTKEAQKKLFEASGDLKMLDEDFLEEIDKFFKWIFSPENLVPQNKVTGQELYTNLIACDGRVADDSLSFLNMWTEHGNKEKLETYKKSFKDRFNKLENDFYLAHDIMKSICASTNFKGESAEEYLNQLKKFMAAEINSQLKPFVIKKYEYGLGHRDIKENHRKVWPGVRLYMRQFVCGDGEDIKEVESDIIEATAQYYYSKLHLEILKNFSVECIGKTLTELAGVEDKCLARFEECTDFQIRSNDQMSLASIRIKEKNGLRDELHELYLRETTKKTKIEENKFDICNLFHQVCSPVKNAAQSILESAGGSIIAAGVENLGLNDLYQNAIENVQTISVIFVCLHLFQILLILYIIFFK